MAKEKSRAEEIIHELQCGGFVFEELEEIIEAAIEAQNKGEDG